MAAAAYFLFKRLLTLGADLEIIPGVGAVQIHQYASGQRRGQYVRSRRDKVDVVGETTPQLDITAEVEFAATKVGRIIRAYRAEIFRRTRDLHVVRGDRVAEGIVLYLGVDIGVGDVGSQVRQNLAS
ncbi:MAG: hypothetical protein ACKOPG_04800 [Novosphingobium sp.]